MKDRLTYLWRSVFRHGWPESPRGRMLAIAGNVFLHLHPARTARKVIPITHTFCLGGLSFFFFIVLTVTGILLMFYYVPSVDRAYTDMQDLETKVRFGMFLRNMHRWAAHAMVITVWLHMIRVFFTRAAAGVQLGRRGRAARADAPVELHRLPLALGSAFLLGGHRRLQPGGFRAHRRSRPAPSHVGRI